jgi:ABC-2 type transport system permease protein
VAEPLAAFRLYRRLVGAQIRSQLQYRVSFALEVVGMFLMSFIDLVAILVIFHNVPQLAGWSSAEVVFLYATSMLAFAFTDMVVGHLDLFPQSIRDGAFDVLLVRPRGTLLQVVRPTSTSAEWGRRSRRRSSSSPRWPCSTSTGPSVAP